MIACHHCGALHGRRSLARGSVAACRACGLFLYEARPNGITNGLALYVAAALMWLVLHAFPLITVEIQGRRLTATLFDGVRALADEGLWPVAVACFLFSSVFPALRILVGFLTLLEASRGRPSPVARFAYKATRAQAPWSMLEVYLLGVIVAYVKLLALADIAVGPAAIALFAAIVLIAWADAAVDPEDVWARIGRSTGGTDDVGARPLACHACGWVTTIGTPARCPRCASHLHRRKTDSLQRTWALLLTALVLYIPANTYPMMVVTQLGNAYPGTILGGVVELIAYGDWPVAAVIFVASVLVPIVKFLALIWLLLSVQYRWTGGLRRKTQLYAAVEWVGRYSMVDVFVVAILGGLIHVGTLFAIDPGVGALAFCGVVVLTMLAAMTFDPRLLWDQAELGHERA